jgi:N6-adenosine-specific RNA methylase IME4
VRAVLNSTIVESSEVPALNEAQARELVPLLDAPAELRAVVAEQYATWGDALTGDVLRRAVQSRLGGEARRAQQHARIAALAAPGRFPAGRYPIILADPPWQLEDRGTPGRRIENHYATLPYEAICAFTDPAGRPVADLAAAVLYLWTFGPKMEEAMAVIRAWGFTYRTDRCWPKSSIGTGQWVRRQHETLLITRRGAFPVPAEANRPSSVIVGPRGRHSEKPDIVYEDIDRTYPGVGPRLELFARTRRPGWDAWGNEVPASGYGDATGGDG